MNRHTVHVGSVSSTPTQHLRVLHEQYRTFSGNRWVPVEHIQHCDERWDNKNRGTHNHGFNLHKQKDRAPDHFSSFLTATKRASKNIFGENKYSNRNTKVELWHVLWNLNLNNLTENLWNKNKRNYWEKWNDDIGRYLRFHCVSYLISYGLLTFTINRPEEDWRKLRKVY